MNKWIIATDALKLGGLVSLMNGIEGPLTAVVVGDAELAAAAACSGVDAVVQFETAGDVPPEALALAVYERAQADQPQVIASNDAAASRVILGFAADAVQAAVVDQVVALEQGAGIVCVREAVDGEIFEVVACEQAAAVIYIGSDAEGEAGGSAPIETVQAETNGAVITAVGQAASGAANLQEAQRIVGVGTGVGSKQNLALIEELAAVLDAQFACTLPICDDLNWFTSEHVLGSSHNSAAPELYIAIGISGSPNHLSGVRDAGTIVAVNNDPDARVFKLCKYGIVGDLAAVVPALTAQLQ